MPPLARSDGLLAANSNKGVNGMRYKAALLIVLLCLSAVNFSGILSAQGDPPTQSIVDCDSEVNFSGSSETTVTYCADDLGSMICKACLMVLAEAKQKADIRKLFICNFCSGTSGPRCDETYSSDTYEDNECVEMPPQVVDCDNDGDDDLQQELYCYGRYWWTFACDDC